MKLETRFTKKQREKAQAIANDIAEDIDNKDSYKDLRMAVDYWASVAADTWMDLSVQRSDKTIRELKQINKQLDKLYYNRFKYIRNG